MIIVTWNLGRRSHPEQMDFLARLGADVVALQEVSAGRTSQIGAEFARIGLPHASWTEPEEGRCSFVQVIGSRWPLAPADGPGPDVPAPERIQRVVLHVSASELELELVNVHVPAATSSGVATKVATFVGLANHLRRPSSRPRIVCGDFNTPKDERDGRTEYWGSAGQQGAEREVIEGLAGLGLPDVYRLLHGSDAQATSWRAKNGVGRRYDHLFASPALDPREAGYASLDHVTRAGLSDHAPLRVAFGRSAPADVPMQRGEAPPEPLGSTETMTAVGSPPPRPSHTSPAARSAVTGDLDAFLAMLTFRTDVREAPDDRRRSQFRTGWMRADNGKPYAARTLEKLTWNNLGYRAGIHFGPASTDKIAATFDALADRYARERRVE